MSDTSQIINAVIGTGAAPLGILVGLLVSLFRIQRQDRRALRQEVRAAIATLRRERRDEIAAINNRIDNLYQALFSHKDPVA